MRGTRRSLHNDFVCPVSCHTFYLIFVICFTAHSFQLSRLASRVSCSVCVPTLSVPRAVDCLLRECLLSVRVLSQPPEGIGVHISDASVLLHDRSEHDVVLVLHTR